jgi:hypothetical protein
MSERPLRQPSEFERDYLIPGWEAHIEAVRGELWQGDYSKLNQHQKIIETLKLGGGFWFAARAGRMCGVSPLTGSMHCVHPDGHVTVYPMYGTDNDITFPREPTYMAIVRKILTGLVPLPDELIGVLPDLLGEIPEVNQDESGINSPAEMEQLFT